MPASEASALGRPGQECAGWHVLRREAVSSTQELARALPPWSAVVADRQDAGRGQARRVFVSDAGGFFLTAVVPFAPEPRRWRGFSLAVGWAVRAALRGLGVDGVRLRWPNDLMFGSRKLGGILVEQGGPDTLLVGVGLNVTNRPWAFDPELRATATSLAESLSVVPTPVTLLAPVLRAIRAVHEEFERTGLAGMVMRLNTGWGPLRTVELELSAPAGRLTGEFLGISEAGDVEIAIRGERVESVPPHRVVRLREL